jgi:hypothetical protein
MPDELRFDRKLLEEAIDWAGPEGEGKHRLVYHFLCMLRQMGWNWRKEYLVVLDASWPPSLKEMTEEE